MLRPRPARWFEILAARDDATLVLEALARTGAVELEARAAATLPAPWAALLPLLARHLELQSRYQAWWPAAETCCPSPFPQAPLDALQASLATISAWAQEAEPLIQALQQARAEQQELQLWQQVLPELRQGPIATSRLATSGPWISVRLFALPAGCDTAGLLSAQTDLVVTPLPMAQAPHLLAAGPPAALQAMAQAVTALEGTVHRVPPWLGDDAAGNLQQLALRLAALAAAIEQDQQALAALHRRHGLPRALGDANRLHWLLQNVHALESGEWLCWVTGWSSDREGGTLAQALRASGARALLHFPPPPPGARAPLLLDNPAWARPFEIFSRALGMPAAAEADPSPVLALAVPLMFGYMFGDVGQGLVIAAGGAWAAKRSAIARLLMVGGIAAAGFGLLFGSVFSLHGLLPVLWLHPLDAPLTVLLAPLLGGALLLTLGLGLDALAAWWRSEMLRWWRTDAALVLVYLALLAAFAEPAALALAAGGLAWFCAGHAWQQRRAAAAFGAIGEALERTLQILVNTLSFARVGAFALAHAGLSSAIVALMDAADGGLAKALVLVLGNALVIVLEAMVVAIQTTRLVLFEFFARFMRGAGRAFRPLPAPPFTVQER